MRIGRWMLGWTPQNFGYYFAFTAGDFIIPEDIQDSCLLLLEEIYIYIHIADIHITDIHITIYLLQYPYYNTHIAIYIYIHMYLHRIVLSGSDYGSASKGAESFRPLLAPTSPEEATINSAFSYRSRACEGSTGEGRVPSTTKAMLLVGCL